MERGEYAAVADVKEARSIMQATRKWHGRLPLRWLTKSYLPTAMRKRKFPKPSKSWATWITHVKSQQDARTTQANAADSTPDTYARIMLDFGWRHHRLTSLERSDINKLIATSDLPLRGSPFVVAMTMLGLIANAEKTIAAETLVRESRKKKKQQQLEIDSSSDNDSDSDEMSVTDFESDGEISDTLSFDDASSPNISTAFVEATETFHHTDRLLHDVKTNLQELAQMLQGEAAQKMRQVMAVFIDVDMAIEANEKRMRTLAMHIDSTTANADMIRFQAVMHEVASALNDDQQDEPTKEKSSRASPSLASALILSTGSVFGMQDETFSSDKKDHNEHANGIGIMAETLEATAAIARISEHMELFGLRRGFRGGIGLGRGLRSGRGLRPPRGGVRAPSVGRYSLGRRGLGTFRPGGRVMAPALRYPRARIGRQFAWRNGYLGTRLIFPGAGVRIVPFTGRRYLRRIAPSLGLWLGYPWFRLWYYQYHYDMYYANAGRMSAVAPYYRPLPPGAIATDAGSVAGMGLPPLGYIDRSWAPDQIDAHIRYLEGAYATTVAQGYRIILNPLTSRLEWVSNPVIPSQGATLPGGFAPGTLTY